MASAYQAARQRAASIDRSSRGRIVVSGKDRASYLQGLLTNDIVALTAGLGLLCGVPHAAGPDDLRPLGYELGDVILLSLPSVETKNTVLAKLDQFIFSEDVQLGDVTDTFAQVAVVGPAAAPIVAALLGESQERVGGLAEHGCLRGAIAGGAAIVARVTDTGEPGFDVYVEAKRLTALAGGLAAGGVAGSWTRTRPTSCAWRRAFRCFTATWTKRRSRSRPASRRARSA